MLQILIEHFEAECRHHGETGMIVADRSSHHADQHASRCVASYVASRQLDLHPSVYYASSMTTEAIQVADLFADARRRIAEGAATVVATVPVTSSGRSACLAARRRKPALDDR